MKILIPTAVAVVALGAITVLTTAGWDRPPISYTQTGFRGLAIEQGINPRTQGPVVEANQSPAPPDPLPPSDAKPVSKVYKNVKVLGDVKEDAFLQLMTAMAEWVAPVDQGCAFCHNPADFADESLYTYKVARRMLEMTRDLNANWKIHVAASAPTGVTCYTCHRGQPVPGDIWFKNPGPLHALGAAGFDGGQNHPTPVKVAGLTSLNYDPFTPFLADKPQNLRVEGLEALPTGSKVTLQQTEQTYALMISIQKALGENCTFCHNSQQFASWEMSTPKRVTAWHGLQMVRDINTKYLEPLAAAGVFPANRLGPTGDGPKANCGTCHRGVNKPLYGVSLVSSFPALIGPAAK